MATSRAMVSHSMPCIVAFHGLVILSVMGKDGIEGGKIHKPADVDQNKRNTLIGAAAFLGTMAVGTGAVAAADYLGKKKNPNEELENQEHALRVYQQYDTNGVLEANFNEYRKIVRQESDAIRLKDAGDKNGPDPADFKPKRMEIESRRDFDLRNFDKVLIPKLLVLYLKNETKKSLGEAYKGLFTDEDERTEAINKIKKDGEGGVDKTRIVKIHSKLQYFPDMNSAETRRSPLSFIAEK